MKFDNHCLKIDLGGYMEIELEKLFIDCSNIDIMNHFALETEVKYLD